MIPVVQPHTRNVLSENILETLFTPELQDNPKTFVKYIFRWDESPLKHSDGIRQWQEEVLDDIACSIQENREALRCGKPLKPYKLAISSARGVGKTALLAWIAYWFLCTRIGSTVAISANSDEQCKTTTFAELRRWHAWSINSYFFEANITSLNPSLYYANILKEQGFAIGGYGAHVKLWKEESPDSYAGSHNSQGYMLIFDESSGIPTSIHDVSEGFFTENILDRFWISCSNPRRSVGKFFDIFDKNLPDWRKKTVSGFDVEEIDHTIYHNLIAEHGEDSNVVRHDVYGLFPLQDSDQFMSRVKIEQAMERPLVIDLKDPLIMGVDIAGRGNDETIACFRHGTDVRSIPLYCLKEEDQTKIFDWVVHLYALHRPDIIVVDSNGIGNGVYYFLKKQGFPVHEHIGQRQPNDKDHYANKRAENHHKVKNWLAYGCLPVDEKLKRDLLSLRCEVMAHKIQLISKEKMRAKGFSSPDRADALALTFELALPLRRTGILSNFPIRSRRIKSWVEEDRF